MAVSFVLIALCFQSCGTCRKATVTQTSAEIRVSADSLTREVRVLKTVTVPMSEAVLKIPTDSLRKLPEAAEYRAKSGQASAVVKHRGDTIIVYATCDSLQRANVTSGRPPYTGTAWRHCSRPLKRKRFGIRTPSVQPSSPLLPGWRPA